MALVAILVGACSSASAPPSEAPPAHDGGTGTPTGSCATLAACCPKAPGTQQAACNTVASDDEQSACSNDLPSFQSAGYCPVTGDYPPGPYGMAVGMTFPDLKLMGYLGGTGPWTTIDLEHYYDPDGSRGINGLYVTGSAPWCAGCVAEGQSFPALFANKYEAEGAKLLTALLQDTSMAPATQATVDSWIAEYHTTYDIAADPGLSVLPTNDQGGGSVALPYNYVIDPRTMRVVQINAGPYFTGGGIAGLDAVLAKNAMP